MKNEIEVRHPQTFCHDTRGNCKLIRRIHITFELMTITKLIRIKKHMSKMKIKFKQVQLFYLERYLKLRFSLLTYFKERSKTTFGRNYVDSVHPWPTLYSTYE